jgi:hypothetical protein
MHRFDRPQVGLALVFARAFTHELRVAQNTMRRTYTYWKLEHVHQRAARLPSSR